MTLTIEAPVAEGLELLEREWEPLRARTSLPGPFTGFSWNLEWWRSLGAGRRLRLLTARRGGMLEGILPFYEDTLLGARRLRFVGSPGGGSDRLDVIAQDVRTRAALLEAAVDRFAPDLVALEDLDDASLTIPVAAGLARARGRVRVEPRFACPYLPIRGTWSDFLRRAPRRDNLRRREKWLRAQPGFELRCETDPAAVPLFLARFHRLHAARWHDDGGTQAFPDGRLVRFHERILERFAEEGHARLWTMTIAREPVAVAYTFDDGARSLYYQSGFAPAWRSRSVGLVLLARYLEDAFERGVSEVDFLRGNEAYKRDWARDARRTVTLEWIVTRRGEAAVSARAAMTRLRSTARDALPEGARRWITRPLREARRRSPAG